MNALRAWKASFTRRWHTNFDLADTLDYNAGHQGRVALLMLALKPDVSRVALIHAITHDQGEVAVGDVSFDVKRSISHDCREQLAFCENHEIVEQFGDIPNLTPKEVWLLKLCDWLDAWLWMMRHARHLYARADWQKQLADVRDLAADLGLDEEVEALIAGTETRV